MNETLAPDDFGPPVAAGLAPPTGEDFARRIRRGLLWRELLQHGRVINGFFAAWLILGFVLLAFAAPGVLLVFGALFALWAGMALGGADAAEGAEEFVFALPPPRALRYRARLALGLGLLLFLVGGGLLAGLFAVPQFLWGLVVDSGFAGPPQNPGLPGNWLALSLAAPFAAFACTFALAANANTRAGANAAWLPGGIAAALGGGWLAEAQLWGPETGGIIASGGVAVLGALALLAGYRGYVRKEGVSRPAPASGGSRAWLLLIGLLFLLLAATCLLWSSGGASAPLRDSNSRPRAHSAPPPAKKIAAPKPEEGQP